MEAEAPEAPTTKVTNVAFAPLSQRNLKTITKIKKRERDFFC